MPTFTSGSVGETVPADGKPLWTERDGRSIEQAITAGLHELVRPLVGRFPGTTRVAVDGGYQPGTVAKACLALGETLRARVCMARGFATYYPKPKGASARGVVRLSVPGAHEITTPRECAELRYDAGMFRAATQRGFALPPFSPGSVSLFGTPGQRHSLFAQHIAGDKLLSTGVSREGRTVYNWQEIGPNHWLDATVMAVVSAVVDGADPTVEATETDASDAAAKERRRKERMKIVQFGQTAEDRHRNTSDWHKRTQTMKGHW